MGSHSICANLTHFEVGSHSSEAADLDRSVSLTSLKWILTGFSMVDSIIPLT